MARLRTYQITVMLPVRHDTAPMANSDLPDMLSASRSITFDMDRALNPGGVETMLLTEFAATVKDVREALRKAGLDG
jgi:hypothetical protein